MCGLKSAVAAAGLWRGPALAGAASFSPTPWQEGPRAGPLPLPSLGIPRRSSAMWPRRSRADANGTRSSRTPCPTGSSNIRFRLRSTRTLWMRIPFCTQKAGGLPRGSSQVPRLPGLLPRRDFRPRIICVQNGLLVQLGRDSVRHLPVPRGTGCPLGLRPSGLGLPSGDRKVAQKARGPKRPPPRPRPPPPRPSAAPLPPGLDENAVLHAESWAPSAPLYPDTSSTRSFAEARFSPANYLGANRHSRTTA